jgi:ABC-type lipoprotein release transport system permease subunit
VTLYLRLAWRNVWRQRRRTFLIAGAMGVIVMLLMIYDGVIVGYEQAIYGNAIQVMGGNIQVHAPGYQEATSNNPLLPMADPDEVVRAAESHPDVVLATKRIITGGLVTNREGAFSVTIIGLETEKESQISIEAQNISAGRYLVADDGDMVLIGQGLATVMDVEVGDRITMAGKSTHEQTRQRTMTIIGIYDLGVASVEKGTIFISLNEAQQLFGLNGQVTEVVVSLKQLGKESGVINMFNAKQPGYEVDTWETVYPELKQGIEMDKSVIAVFSIVMLGIAAIGILNLLMMAVFERTREIGILGALGLKPRQVTILFLLEGILIGLTGAVLGAILGTIVGGILSYYGFDFSQWADMADYTAFFTDRFYPPLVPLKILDHGLTLLIISALASIYPAYQASRQEPAEALHNV